MINADESTPDRLTPERLDITFGVLESEMDFLKKNIHKRKKGLKKFMTVKVTMWKCLGDTIEQEKADTHTNIRLVKTKAHVKEIIIVMG